MTYIKKESLYDLLENFERLYPEATAAFRVAVAEMPEGVVRCRNCDAHTTELAGQPVSWCCRHEYFVYVNDFCSDGAPKGGAE